MTDSYTLEYHDVAVIGGTGGIGTAIADSLPTFRHNVRKFGSAELDVTTDTETLAPILAPFDTIVYCAGINAITFGSSPINHRIYDVNLFGLLRVLEAIGTGQPRVLIYVSSVLVNRSTKGTRDYTASKAAAEAVVRCVAREWPRGNVRATTLRLGYFDTGIIRDVPKAHLENVLGSTPGGKLCNPNELARVIDTIVRTPSINGSFLTLDGGFSC